jgi:pimeloyl-ACP methyl ester carboxylesterase
MPFLAVNDSDIYYTDHGVGDPVVLLHGRSASGACWDWHIERLKESHRVIAFDSVNHGFSSNSPRDLPEPDRRAELDGVLAALGLEAPALIGQSQGAMTILRWAARNPDRASTIVLTGMGWPIGSRSALPSPAPLRDGLWLESRNFEPRWAEGNPEIVERYSRLRSTATAIEAARHPRTPSAESDEWFDESFGDRIQGIRTPISIVVGALDFVVEGARNLAALLPDARLEVVAGADHNAYLQACDTFLDVVGEALAAR